VDAGDLRRALAERDARVDLAHEGLPSAVGQQLDERELDDAVGRDVEAGGFEVEEDERARELEDHDGNVRHAARADRLVTVAA
jgi:hypothetical protein